MIDKSCASKDFDPYYKWLGIPQCQQPPDHYQLLGIVRFEADADVISNAADRQTTHIRSFRLGKHTHLCERLLNEVSAARVCLLNPGRKEEYDTRLRTSTEARRSGLINESPTGSNVDRVSGNPEVVNVEWPVPPLSRPLKRLTRRDSRTSFFGFRIPRAIVPIAVFVAVVLIVLLCSYLPYGGRVVSLVKSDRSQDASQRSQSSEKPGASPNAHVEPEVPSKKRSEGGSYLPQKEPALTPNENHLPVPADPHESEMPVEPLLAVSPLDGTRAKQSQGDWADHFDLPVEFTNSIGMKLVVIPAGEFDMGSTQEDVERLLAETKQRNEPPWYIDRLPGEAPKHRVRVTRTFCLGAFEVTVGQFRQFAADAGYVTEAEEDGLGGYGVDATGRWVQIPTYTWRQPGFEQRDDHPVVNVSWNDVVAFCEWLSRKEGTLYRLPTEAEWEYACRAGSTTQYSFGDDPAGLQDHAWFGENSSRTTHPVGEKCASRWGLYDMHGNVWEWCADWYDEIYYKQSPVDDPTGPATGSLRAHRGGGWYDPASLCRAAYRYRDRPDIRRYDLGFRVAAVLSAGPSSEQQAAAQKLGRPVVETNSIDMKLALIPAGEFQMGSPAGEEGRDSDEQQHQVRITKPFYLGVSEVTQEQYERVMGNNPSNFKGLTHPVESMSWEDSVAFCDKLSTLPEEKAAGRKYRLPTEAEWEYACRAGSTTQYSFGDNPAGLKDHAWFIENSSEATHPVGEKCASPWGLYDMHGNVWEWCADWLDTGYYMNSPVDDPTGPPTGLERLGRGGGWHCPPSSCRAARRGWNQPALRFNHIGFRVAADLLAGPASESANGNR